NAETAGDFLLSEWAAHRASRSRSRICVPPLHGPGGSRTRRRRGGQAMDWARLSNFRLVHASPVDSARSVATQRRANAGMHDRARSRPNAAAHRTARAGDASGTLIANSESVRKAPRPCGERGWGEGEMLAQTAPSPPTPPPRWGEGASRIDSQMDTLLMATTT